MILLQILTGRRAQRDPHLRVRLPVPGPTARPAPTARAARTVSRSSGSAMPRARLTSRPTPSWSTGEVAAVIEEQRQWIRDQFPEREHGVSCSCSGSATSRGRKPYSSGTYGRWLREFSAVGRDHRQHGPGGRGSATPTGSGHTKLTRLAELGLPIKVLQRYAGPPARPCRCTPSRGAKNTPSRHSW